MLCAARRAGPRSSSIAAAVARSSALADTHRSTPMVGRTLTQARASRPPSGSRSPLADRLLDAPNPWPACATRCPPRSAARWAPWPRSSNSPARSTAPVALASLAPSRWGWRPAPPWHTTRAPVTRIGDALVGRHDALGPPRQRRATGSRPRSGSSPRGAAAARRPCRTRTTRSLAVLLRRPALTAGPLAAHPAHRRGRAGRRARRRGWHAEWATLATLARRTVVAASHATELVTGLRVAHRPVRPPTSPRRGDLLAEQAHDGRAGWARRPHRPTSAPPTPSSARRSTAPAAIERTPVNVPRLVGTDLGGPADASAAAARAVPGHLRRHAVDPRGPAPARAPARPRVGPARPRPQPRRPRPSPSPTSRRGVLAAGRPSRRRRVPLRRRLASAAPSGCSCCSTRRTGSRGHGAVHRRRGSADPGGLARPRRSGPRDRHGRAASAAPPSAGSPRASPIVSPTGPRRCSPPCATPTTASYAAACDALGRRSTSATGSPRSTRPCWPSPACTTRSRPPGPARSIADGVRRRPARGAPRRRAPGPGRGPGTVAALIAAHCRRRRRPRRTAADVHAAGMAVRRAGARRRPRRPCHRRRHRLHRRLPATSSPSTPGARSGPAPAWTGAAAR